MKRFRHPIRQLKEPFGKAGLTVAILALVLAMVGGAYAAGGLTKSQEKQVKKIAKKYAGKPGAPGTNGTNGSPGAPGKNGENGAPGTPGSAGKSVVLGTATSGECPGSNPTGGVKVEVEGNAASKKAVCNGKEGSPWTAGGTLPTGKTETGAWAYGPITEAALSGEFPKVPVASFAIPLAEPLINTAECGEVGEPACQAHYIAAGGTAPTECENSEHPGTASSENPEAAPGNFCIYAAFENNVSSFNGGIADPGAFGERGTGTTGAVLLLLPVGGGTHTIAIQGTWAVTAE